MRETSVILIKIHILKWFLISTCLQIIMLLLTCLCYWYVVRPIRYTCQSCRLCVSGGAEQVIGSIRRRLWSSCSTPVAHLPSSITGFIRTVWSHRWSQIVSLPFMVKQVNVISLHLKYSLRLIWCLQFIPRWDPRSWNRVGLIHHGRFTIQRPVLLPSYTCLPCLCLGTASQPSTTPGTPPGNQ